MFGLKKGVRTMLVENEYFNLFLRGTDVLIHPKQLGYPLKEFELITRLHPRLKIVSFPILKEALTELETEHVIGIWRPLTEITISKDRLEAEVVINCTKETLEEKKRVIIDEITAEMNELGIVFGHLPIEPFLKEGKLTFPVAKGKKAVQGANAVIRYIERPERKPVIREDGSANYYEMNFVYSVKENAWLGEKIPAQPGEEGMDLFGNPISALHGKDESLLFDQKSVYLTEENGQEVLRAKHSGTVEFERGVVHVGNLLVIEEDVGPNTGDINFKGAVTIKGTIHPGYSVRAVGDISIESEEGITNASQIQSAKGDIFIKGGVFGGNETVIEAYGNIYLKHANNCKIYGLSIHVGLYLFGTEVFANYVYVDQTQGRIIGGTIEAIFKVEAAIIGNLHERETIIRVKGIDQAKQQQNAQELVGKLKEQRATLTKVEQYIETVEKNKHLLTFEQRKAYEQAEVSKETLTVEMGKVEEQLAHTLKLLKITEEPELHIAKNVYPGTKIEVGKRIFPIKHEMHGVFHAQQEVNLS